ncbi:hypothetical protein K1T71_005759 [Dendrolimus kikuchii]|uniref:Uncharacterized protein n=1 Tax=Dendrolimus kikuchii TaxID=765133 RepID=A0ACC1D4W8_9NEOP|nr:hypothetical protein K1T71_005759 [Dendrolimus kikuchii]
MTSAVHFLFFTIVATSAYKCNEEGCSNRNFEQPRSGDLVYENAKSIARAAPHSVVSRSSHDPKTEDESIKENRSHNIHNENQRNYRKISSRAVGDTFVPVIPEECKRTGICEDVPNYPEEAVVKLLASLSEDQRKFQIDQLDVPDTPDIDLRAGPVAENMDLCASRKKIVYPKAAPDQDGNWYMIVNPTDKPIQGVRVEICENEESPCADFVKFEVGYQARCVQKYFQRAMQSLDDTGAIVEKTVTLPSCCSCVAKAV